MPWTIKFPYEDVEQFVIDLPPGLRARYIILADTLLEFGSNLRYAAYPRNVQWFI